MKNSADQGGCYPQRPKICRIPHILRKPNSIMALLFIQNISSFLGVSPFRSLFYRSPNITPCNLVARFLRSTVQ